MAFTYADGLATPLNRLRARLGDTEIAPAGVMPDGANLSDAMLVAILAQVADEDAAVAMAAQLIAAKWRSAVTKFSADGVSVDRGDMVAKWDALAASGGQTSALPTFSSLTLSRSSINS